MITVFSGVNISYCHYLGLKKEEHIANAHSVIKYRSEAPKEKWELRDDIFSDDAIKRTKEALMLLGEAPQ